MSLPLVAVNDPAAAAREEVLKNPDHLANVLTAPNSSDEERMDVLCQRATSYCKATKCDLVVLEDIARDMEIPYNPPGLTGNDEAKDALIWMNWISTWCYIYYNGGTAVLNLQTWPVFKNNTAKAAQWIFDHSKFIYQGYPAPFYEWVEAMRRAGGMFDVAMFKFFFDNYDYDGRVLVPEWPGWVEAIRTMAHTIYTNTLRGYAKHPAHADIYDKKVANLVEILKMFTLLKDKVFQYGVSAGVAMTWKEARRMVAQAGVQFGSLDMVQWAVEVDDRYKSFVLTAAFEVMSDIRTPMLPETTEIVQWVHSNHPYRVRWSLYWKRMLRKQWMAPLLLWMVQNIDSLKDDLQTEVPLWEIDLIVTADMSSEVFRQRYPEIWQYLQSI